MKRPTLTGLRLPLVAGLAAVMAAGGLLYWTHTERITAERLLQAETAHLAQARTRHIETLRIDTQARSSLKQLNTLRAAGLLATPDRSAWQRHLLAVQSGSGLDTLDWEISPQHPVELPGATPSHLVAATLRLHGDVPHEAHLLELLKGPPAAGQGLVAPRRCRLARTASDDALSLDCEIDWISLHLPDTPS